MNYTVCDTQNHCRDVTDAEYNKWREAQGKNIIVTAGGNILDRETEKKIGSAHYYNEKLAETLKEAGNRADVLIKDAAKTMAVNAAMTATGVIALRGLSYAAQSAQELGHFQEHQGSCQLCPQLDEHPPWTYTSTGRSGRGPERR